MRAISIGQMFENNHMSLRHCFRNMLHLVATDNRCSKIDEEVYS
jgi:hypothetical protein